MSADDRPPLGWADGLCRIHCREDRCCFGCSCPGHNEDGTHTPQGPSIDELRAALVGPAVPLDRAAVDAAMDATNKLVETLIELCGRLSQRITEVDEHALGAVERLADAMRVLSDRIGMLELDRKGDQR